MTEKLEPIIDWIGDIPLLHGERDGWIPGEPDPACLCGHQPYYLCPESITGGIASMVIGAEWGGRFTAAETSPEETA